MSKPVKEKINDLKRKAAELTEEIGALKREIDDLRFRLLNCSCGESIREDT